MPTDFVGGIGRVTLLRSRRRSAISTHRVPFGYELERKRESRTKMGMISRATDLVEDSRNETFVRPNDPAPAKRARTRLLATEERADCFCGVEY